MKGSVNYQRKSRFFQLGKSHPLVQDRPVLQGLHCPHQYRGDVTRFLCQRPAFTWKGIHTMTPVKLKLDPHYVHCRAAKFHSKHRMNKTSGKRGETARQKLVCAVHQTKNSSVSIHMILNDVHPRPLFRCYSNKNPTFLTPPSADEYSLRAATHAATVQARGEENGGECGWFPGSHRAAAHSQHGSQTVI